MAQKTRPQAESLYGMPQPLQTGFLSPIIAKRDPTTEDTGFALGQPWNNKINNNYWILTSVVAGSANWQVSAGSSGYPTTPYVVGPAGQAGYQTIQSAINAANTAGGGIVVVQPGNYIENLTLYSNVHIMGLTFADAGGGATITGMHTPPATGGFVFRNVRLISATNIFNSSAAGSAHLVLADAEVFVTNGYTFNLPNWTGKLESFDVNAAVGTNDGYVNNTAGAEVDIFECSVGSGSLNPMIVSGFTLGAGANIYCPIHFQTGATVEFDYSFFGNTLTFSNNSTGIITTSHLSSGASAAIIMSSSAAWMLSTCTISSSNNPVINGAGSGIITLVGINFTNASNIAGTLTVAWSTTKTGNTTITGNLTFPTAGAGLVFNANTATGAAASPVILNSRAGQVIFTSVSIAAAADLTLTITNSQITASTTQVIYSMSGATTGSALSIKSVTNSSGSSAIVVTNGTGATTSTSNITINFIVLN